MSLRTPSRNASILTDLICASEMRRASVCWRRALLTVDSNAPPIISAVMEVRMTVMMISLSRSENEENWRKRNRR